jgi:hypothetical protein
MADTGRLKAAGSLAGGHIDRKLITKRRRFDIFLQAAPSCVPRVNRCHVSLEGSTLNVYSRRTVPEGSRRGGSVIMRALLETETLTQVTLGACYCTCNQPIRSKANVLHCTKQPTMLSRSPSKRAMIGAGCLPISKSRGYMICCRPFAARFGWLD